MLWRGKSRILEGVNMTSCSTAIVVTIMAMITVQCHAAAAAAARDSSGSTRGRGRAPTIIEHPISLFAVVNRAVTLRCRHSVESGNMAQVNWYKDNIKVATHYDNPSSFFSLDPAGDLLILQFLPDYTGSYYCNVTNNYGTALSNSAAIEVAYINDDFESGPKSVIAASGQEVQFACAPPHAMPRPTISWRTDAGGQGSKVMSDGGAGGRARVATEPTGRGVLTLVNASNADAGEYWCVAENDAGSKVSGRAQLSVEERPLFIVPPKDSTTKVGGSVTLLCVAQSGNSLAAVTWIKDAIGRTAPPVNSSSRWAFSADGNLSIQRIVPDDEGLYTCLARSSGISSVSSASLSSTPGGLVVRASAYLTVETLPYVLGRPVDRAASVGGTAYFHCHADSSPPPRIIWQKANSTEMVFARSSNAAGRLVVFDNGTLRIGDIRQQDAGEYSCIVINSAGSNSAQATLTVVLGTVSDQPPMIVSPPTNMAAMLGSSAFLTCSVDGRPPVVRWLKNGRPLLAGGRFMIVGPANLRISDVQVGDSGSYTCLAMSRSADATATAVLSVTGLLNHSMQRGSLPPPPGKPQAKIFERSVVLTWPPRAQSAQQPDDWTYRVEAFTYSDPQGWAVSPWLRPPGYSIPFMNVITGAAYYFVVRARSSSGLMSEASPPSDVLHIPGPSNTAVGSSTLQQQVKEAADAISRTPIVDLAGMPYATSSTSINVSWTIVNSGSKVAASSNRASRAITFSQCVEGFYVRVYSGRGERRTDVVFSSHSTHHLVAYLEPYTSYRVSVAPFYAGEAGMSTPVVEVTTSEDVPSGPPLDLRAIRSSNGTSMLVSWQQPELRHHNGNILGYFVACAEPRSSRNFTVNGVSSTTLSIDSLRPDAEYRLSVTAFTSIGSGVPSDPVQVSKWSPAEGQLPSHDVRKPVTEEPWFLPTVIGFMGMSVGAIILILVVCLCLRHRSANPWCSKKGRFLAVSYQGERTESTTPEAYLTYRLEAFDRTPSLPLSHDRFASVAGDSATTTHNDWEFDSEVAFRTQTPVPAYPPAPPPTSRKIVEEHNLDSSGDSTPAVTGMAHRQSGGRKGALYSKASVLESLGEAGSAAAEGPGPYATTCLYNLSQESARAGPQSSGDSHQMPTGQVPAPTPDRFNLRGGSESSCTDNNGRSSAGTGSEATPVPGDQCSCCTADGLLRGQSPQPPHFTDMLPPPPPQYQYYPLSPLTNDPNGFARGNWPQLAGAQLPAHPCPTSVATLLRHVRPPPPLLHQHSAPQMGEPTGASHAGHRSVAARSGDHSLYCPRCAHREPRAMAGPRLTGKSSAKPDDTATVCSQRSTGSETAREETPSTRCHACACSRHGCSARSRCPPAQCDLCATGLCQTGPRRNEGFGERLCPHVAGSTGYAPGLHGTTSYPSGLMVGQGHDPALAEETSSAAEYEEPWEDQPWLYDPTAWSGVMHRHGERGPALCKMFQPLAAVLPSHTCTARHGVNGRHASEGAAKPTYRETNSDQDDEVAAAMACIQPPPPDSAADSLDSSDTGETELVTDSKSASKGRADRQPRHKAAHTAYHRRQAANGFSHKRPTAKCGPRNGRRRTPAPAVGGAAAGGYSTDSSFVFVPLPRRPYPKSARRRQMQHHHYHQRHSKLSSAQTQDAGLADDDDEATDQV